jgi:CheY-like chemotaxis protein
MGNTILLADKSITIQKIVQLTFADDNYQIHCVSDGQAALESIHQVRPDLVLADISLPLKSGYDICSTLRSDSQYSDFANIPVILLAGIYETMDEERARIVEEKVKEVQATDFLSKPFDPQLLISKVKQYISGSPPTPTAEIPIFAEESDSAINLFDSESLPPVSEPVDDGEKTMMLPGGPFGSMFAEELPPEEEPKQEKPRPQVEIENVLPVGEPIFSEEEFPQVELGSEDDDQETVNVASSQLADPVGEAFSGREEQVFEYTGSDLEESQANSIPLVLPDTEEPFSDVFQESGPSIPWTPLSSTEEDSPFGLPEPPPAPEPEPEPEIMIEPPPQFVESPIMEIPMTAAEQPEAGFDDTWPGVQLKMNISQPVEELFESDVPSAHVMDDVEELEPDLAETSLEDSEEIPKESEVLQSSPVLSQQLTEDLIDKIAEKVINKLSERVVSEIVWQVVPDLAEKMIRRELEKLHAGED